jgi:D-serine deaminase-like pyridoxal phosphate-dependent protein
VPATATVAADGLSPAARLSRYESALAELDAPFAFVDLDAMWVNSADMLRRARGKPIRIASKSLRCRGLLSAVLERDAGYHGLLTFTLPETLWLFEQGFRDLLVAYPTTDRAALRELAAVTAPPAYRPRRSACASTSTPRTGWQAAG